MTKNRFLLVVFLFHSVGLLAQWNPEQIEIIRDKWGVPHIYAPTDAQVSYGLAWAHAEDYFKTIQFTLLAAKKLLGQYMGREGAPIDYVVGLLRCEEIVANHIDDVSPAFMKVAQGYLAGINAYALAHPKEILLKKFFPLTIEDMFQAYVLQLAIIDGADGMIPKLFKGDIDKAALKGIGSNAMAFNRQKTKSDQVFLAINSHQPLEGPAAWYEAHLVSDEGWNMMGGLFPGGPIIFHGTNEYLGWAHTVNSPDKLDVFELEMSPDYENKYRIDDYWYELEHRVEKLKIKLFSKVNITVKKDAYYSKYGPVVKNEKGVFAFNMAIFHEIRAVEQWYNMNKATNLTEFKAALEMTGIPGFNIVYADREDNIFYVGNGKITMRDASFDGKGSLPGNTHKTLTTTYHPFSDLPQLTNPTSGYLFNTNNAAFNATASRDNLQIDNFDPTMGFEAHENNRSTRFMELMRQYDKISLEDFLKIKYDVTLPDSLMFNINVNNVFKMEPLLAGRAADVVRILQSWNRSSELNDMGMVHFNEFYRHLMNKSGTIDVGNVQPNQMIESLLYTHDYLIEHFGNVEVTVGEYQFLVRGKKALPIMGLGDVLAAMYSGPYKEGRVKGIAGESYIMLVKYPSEGLPIIETVNNYGASNHSDSPHYDDQMELFVNQQRKSMTLDINLVRKEAVRIYHPQ